ncbi:hypothetical protein FSP39_000951 [Pinctada imbricata]|uniref:CUB domain-containing protein n=1 Tax=Pinctada imbricata TaxID=66713 RepID=A0AA89BTQ8_PINIB|nr:hypothetical protein FSP39_000951 [Pinctada imbricata]
MCDAAGSRIINQRKGVIRSHENYPWNYPEGVQCKIQIKVASNETLVIWKEMFEIDRSRDKLKAWHVHNETCETRKYLDKYEIRKPIRVTGGLLKLAFFTSSKRSRSGKGFLLMFDINVAPRDQEQKEKEKKNPASADDSFQGNAKADASRESRDVILELGHLGNITEDVKSTILTGISDLQTQCRSTEC